MNKKNLLKALGIGLMGAAACAAPGCRRSVDRDPSTPLSVVQHASRKTLSAFASEAELAGFLSDLARARRLERESQGQDSKAEDGYGEGVAAEMEAAPPAPPAQAAPAASSATKAEESVT